MVGERPAFLHSMSNATAYGDDSISFSIHRADGASFDISCSMDQLADVLRETLKKAENATVGTAKLLIFRDLESAALNFSVFP